MVDEDSNWLAGPCGWPISALAQIHDSVVQSWQYTILVLKASIFLLGEAQVNTIADYLLDVAVSMRLPSVNRVTCPR